MNLISLGVAFSLLASSVGALWPSATKVYPTSIPQTTQEVKWMTIEEAVAQSQKDGKKKKKIPLREEAKTIAFAFQSVVATKDILKGQMLTMDNIFLRRPGNGSFKVKDFKKLLGKKVKKNIKKNYQIKFTDILL